MLTIVDRLQSFFSEHRELLEANYSGLSAHRLLLELELISRPRLRLSDMYHLSELTLAPAFWGQWQAQLLQGLPLAYLSGVGPFAGLDLYCDSSTLIPRAETEQLLELLVAEVMNLQQNRPHKSMKIADVGTGTGALLIALAAKIPSPLELWGIDISSAALQLAQANQYKLAHHYSKLHRWHWFQGDRLEATLSQSFEIIVSNPPYIKRSQSLGVHWQVNRFEPAGALYLEDGQYLAWFQLFFEQVWNRLKSGGVFLMEGHEENWPELQSLLNVKAPSWSRIQLLKDLSGRERFLILQRE